jgi:hypothetical protein
MNVVADRQSVECDDDGHGCDALVKAQQDAGATEVMVTLADGSVSRHWVRPEQPARGEGDTGPMPPAQGDTGARLLLQVRKFSFRPTQKSSPAQDHLAALRVTAATFSCQPVFPAYVF